MVCPRSPCVLPEPRKRASSRGRITIRRPLSSRPEPWTYPWSRQQPCSDLISARDGRSLHPYYAWCLFVHVVVCLLSAGAGLFRQRACTRSGVAVEAHAIEALTLHSVDRPLSPRARQGPGLATEGLPPVGGCPPSRSTLISLRTATYADAASWCVLSICAKEL